MLSEQPTKSFSSECPPVKSLRRFWAAKVYRSVPSLLSVHSPLLQAFVQCPFLLRRKLAASLKLFTPLLALLRAEVTELLKAPFQFLPHVLRETTPMLPLFAHFFLSFRRGVTPALLVASNTLLLLRTQMPPP